MSFIDNQNQENCRLCETSKEATNHANKSKTRSKRGTKTVKKTTLFILVLLLIGGVFTFYRLSTNFSLKSAQDSNSASDFTLKDYQGNEVSLSDFHNREPVLLVFWATWCAFCAQELPDLKTFHRQYRKEINVLVVVSDEDKTTVKNYIKDNDISFSILLDKDRKTWNQYSVRGTPTHFLINKQGEIVSERPGLTRVEDLETMLTTLP